MNKKTSLMGEALLARYRELCIEWSDIRAHLPRLQELAFQCSHVTEFGVRCGVSTIALLSGFPDKMVSYDLERRPEVDQIEQLAREAEIDFQFHRADVLTMPVIAETDLLFVDTWHDFAQCSAELQRHGSRVCMYLVFHDVAVPYTGPDNDAVGLRRAISEYQNLHPEWKTIVDVDVDNGLMVLKRC